VPLRRADGASGADASETLAVTGAPGAGKYTPDGGPSQALCAEVDAVGVDRFRCRRKRTSDPDSWRYACPLLTLAAWTTGIDHVGTGAAGPRAVRRWVSRNG
jgi:hypothetical protein